MTGQRRSRASWLDFYDIEHHLASDLSREANAVLVVDVGGGRGHEIQEMKARYPRLPGRLILQDLAGSVDGLVAPPGTEVMPHNFFGAQPIRGTFGIVVPHL